jgi:hypothetical protein
MRSPAAIASNESWFLATIGVMGIMPLYRFYTLDSRGHVCEPPRIIECADDRDAVSQAHRFLATKAVEIWLEAKRVGRLEPPPAGSAAA